MSRRRTLPTFPRSAPKALADTQLRRNLRKATTTIRAKRAGVVSEMPDWEALREAGRAIKEHTLRDLGRHLVELEASPAFMPQLRNSVFLEPLAPSARNSPSP